MSFLSFLDQLPFPMIVLAKVSTYTKQPFLKHQAQNIYGRFVFLYYLGVKSLGIKQMK